MNLKTLTRLASGLSIVATLISFVDMYFLGSTLARLNIPPQVPTYVYLSTVTILCLIILALSNRKLTPPSVDQSKTVEELRKQLNSHSGKDLETAALKEQIKALQAAAFEGADLESRIRAVLMAHNETEAGLISGLRIDTSDHQAISRMQSMLGKMQKDKTVEANFGRFQLVKSF